MSNEKRFANQESILFCGGLNNDIGFDKYCGVRNCGVGSSPVFCHLFGSKREIETQRIYEKRNIYV